MSKATLTIILANLTSRSHKHFLKYNARNGRGQYHLTDKIHKKIATTSCRNNVLGYKLAAWFWHCTAHVQLKTFVILSTKKHTTSQRHFKKKDLGHFVST